MGNEEGRRRARVCVQLFVSMLLGFARDDSHADRGFIIATPPP